MIARAPTVEVEFDGDEAEMRAKVERYLETMVAKFRKLQRKELATHQRRDTGALERGVYEELKAARLGARARTRAGGPGRAGAATCARTLDHACARLGTRASSARARQVYPSLIPAEMLGRCGYFASFPQAVSLVAHLVEDYDLIEEFRQANAAHAAADHSAPSAIPTPEACLTPAVCYHCYQSLEGRTLDERRPHRHLRSASASATSRRTSPGSIGCGTSPCAR